MILFIRRLTLYSIAGILLCCCSVKEDSPKGFNDFDLLEFDISQIQSAYDSGSLSVEDVVQAYISRIEAIDQSGPGLNSVVSINPDALRIAKKLDEELRNGQSRGPLHGIPILLKDNIDTKDKMPTTAGSRVLAQSYPLQDSYVAEKLREAGAVILGKTNLSEWANFRGEPSSSGWSGVLGQTKNPYDLTRNPCGSSSGSAVSVSANLSILAIGTETNGSIVCPSHNNGIVGIKPTVGLVSRSGIIPISFTQDTPGPMARTVRDAVLCLDALLGVDSADSKTLGTETKIDSYMPFLNTDGLSGKKIGIYKPAIGNNFKVDSVFYQAVRDMEAQGATVVEIEGFLTSEVWSSSLEVMLFEYKDGLNAYFKSLGENASIKTVDELIAFNKNDSIELRYYNQLYLEEANAKGDLNSSEYKKALKAATEGAGKNGIDKVMEKHELDALIAPTGSPAWKTDWVNGDNYSFGSSSPAAIAGYPNITVPMGLVEGLPVGISIFGRAWSEGELIEIAYAYEQHTMHRSIPEFHE